MTRRVRKILTLDQRPEVYWRIQDSRFPLPLTSKSGWNDEKSSYDEGHVSFFADLRNAVDMLWGNATDDFGNNYADEIRKNGGDPVLLAATSAYDTEDAPGSEVMLFQPQEVGRWKLSTTEGKELLEHLKK